MSGRALIVTRFPNGATPEYGRGECGKNHNTDIKLSLHSPENTIDAVNHSSALRTSSTHVIQPSSAWINEMDVNLRAQIATTTDQNPRNVAHAYATAMTAVVFAVVSAAIAAAAPKNQHALNASQNLMLMATPLARNARQQQHPSHSYRHSL
jgi:hypothetical protein